ncbi:MAG: S8 family serine peptidase [Gemmatimonadaceae bacterium]
MSKLVLPALDARAVSLRTLATLGFALLLSACDAQRTVLPPSAAVQQSSALLTGSAATADVLVGFTQAPGASQVTLVESLGGRVTRRYKYIPVVAASIPVAQRDLLAASAGVKFVEDDNELAPYGGKQIIDYGVSKIEAPAAWALGYSGQNVKVAIFDSGIDLTNPDLVVVGGVNFIPNSAADPTVDPLNYGDCFGHGTHVGGIVGATNNGNGTVGVAPKAQLYAIRFFDCAGGGATKSRELAGLEWAIDNGMDVINMSFGCCTIVQAGQRIHVPLASEAEEMAMNAAYERGIVLIAASGNSSVVNGQSVNQPVIAYPAAYASVVAVGATDDEDRLSSFSQFGDDQELTAPGVQNLSSYLVGKGSRAALTVDTDGGNELGSIPMLFAGLTSRTGLTSAAVFAGFGSAPEFAMVNCVGKIAVVSRGANLTFAQKTEAAMNAGCAGIVMHNNQPGSFAGTLGTATAPDGRAWIPAISISLDDGLYLDEKIRNGPTSVTLLNTVGNLASLSGTSMASPHAAGVAALVLSKNPNLTPAQVRQVLRASANDLGTPGWDPVFGYGRINAKRAVQQTP